MKKVIAFILLLLKKASDDGIMSVANEMTYKGLLSMFPFIIFLMSLLGFLDIDGNRLLLEVGPYLPEQVMNIFVTFIEEVIDVKSKTLLSTSLVVVIYSASSGFKAIIRGINRSYGIAEKRGFIHTTAVSVLLVFLFAAIIALSLAILIFGDALVEPLAGMIGIGWFAWRFYEIILFFFVMLIILLAVMIIYEASLNRKIKFRNTFPGAAVTVVLWLTASELFNVYVNNFSRYSKIYGSIGGIFILVIWINIIAFILLIGTEINALLESRRI